MDWIQWLWRGPCTHALKKNGTTRCKEHTQTFWKPHTQTFGKINWKILFGTAHQRIGQDHHCIVWLDKNILKQDGAIEPVDSKKIHPNTLPTYFSPFGTQHGMLGPMGTPMGTACPEDSQASGSVPFGAFNLSKSSSTDSWSQGRVAPPVQDLEANSEVWVVYVWHPCLQRVAKHHRCREHPCCTTRIHSLGVRLHHLQQAHNAL